MDVSLTEVQCLRLGLLAQYQGYRLVQDVVSHHWVLLASCGALSFEYEYEVWSWLDRHAFCGWYGRRCLEGNCRVCV